MSFIILRGRWCDVIVLNVHAPREAKVDDMNDRCYDELDLVWHNLTQCYMTILLGDFNAKEVREDIFKQTIGNESLYEIGNYNEVVVNFCHI
jgi:hypothetical protein